MAVKTRKRTVRVQVLDRSALERTVARMAAEIVERDGEEVMLVGIHTRGIPLAHRLAAAIGSATGREVGVGRLDITLYRDDVGPWRPAHRQPVLKETALPASIDERVIYLVDDVLYTGRTVRAALDTPDRLRPTAGDAPGGSGRPRSPRAADRRRCGRQGGCRPSRRGRPGAPGGGGRRRRRVDRGRRLTDARDAAPRLARQGPGGHRPARRRGDPAHPRHRRGDARGGASGRSRRCRRCAARRWSTCSWRRRPGPASRSRWRRSGCRPTPSTSPPPPPR